MGFLGPQLRALKWEFEARCIDNSLPGARRNPEPLLGEPAFDVTRLMNVEGDGDGPVNLGNPIEASLSKWAEFIGSRLRPEFHSPPQDDHRRRCPDIARARRLLRWAPMVQLQDGFSRTIAHFDSVLTGGEALKRIWRAAN